MKNEPGIFLSHNHNDAEFVKRIAADLSRAGARVWYFQAEIKVGDSLFEKIENALKDMSYLGVVLSPHSVKSEWVRREVQIALNGEIEGRSVKILPMLLDHCDIPMFLQGRVRADFTSAGTYDRGLSEILQAMGLAEKAAAREVLLKLARSVMSSSAAVQAIPLGDVVSWSVDVPEKDEFLRVSNEYEREVKRYEEAFQEYYDPVSLFRLS